LLDPQKVRPWTVLRMPKFNMSDEDARALVEYFAAVDKMNNPDLALNESFADIAQRDSSFWDKKSAEYLKGLKRTDEGKKHLEELKKDLPLVWERYLKEQIAQKEYVVEGAKQLLKQDEAKYKPLLTAAEKELKDLEDLKKKKDDSKEYKDWV